MTVPDKFDLTTEVRDLFEQKLREFAAFCAMNWDMTVDQAMTLTEAVDTMGKLQLGRTFTEDENAKIVAFLKTLTGDQPQITLPILPVSSDKTPRPDPFAPIVAPMKK